MTFDIDRYQICIFDWDGTVMDSTARIVNCMQATAVECGLSVPSETQVHRVIGLSMDDALNTIYPNLTAEMATQFYQRYGDNYRNDKTPSPLIDGVKDLFDWLLLMKKHVSVATGKSRRGLDRVITESGMASFIHSSICADESHSKPNPAMIEYLLSAGKFLPERALMIGDSRHDGEMASNAGVDFVGVLSGVDNSETLRDSGASWVFSSVAKLLPVEFGSGKGC